MYMNGHNTLDSNTSCQFAEFVSKSGHDPKNFRRISVEDLPVVEVITQGNIFLCGFDIQEGVYVGELAKDKTIKLEKIREDLGRFDKIREDLIKQLNY